MLVEAGYRGKEIKLAYKDEMFSVPENVFLIGTMNTADRSLAMLDYALRRRFAFIELKPAFEVAGFKDYVAELPEHEKVEALVSKVQELNEEIAKDPALGRGFSIGHSYFCSWNTWDKDGRTEEEAMAGWLQAIVKYELIPMLEEYWFDEDTKRETWTNNLLDVVK